jgi:hypothetical protein
MLTPELFAETTAWCTQVQNEVINNAKSKGLVNTGNLVNSIKCYPVPINDDELQIVFEMWDYGYFQDEGVQGANPSAMKNGKGVQKASGSRFKFGTGSGNGSLFSSLDSWIVKKGIAPRGDKGKFTSRAGLKYAMARSIYLQGLAPRDFFKTLWELKTKELIPLIEQGIIKDIETQWYERIIKTRKN